MATKYRGKSIFEHCLTSRNIGTANAGVYAVEYGDAHCHTTKLTVNAVNSLTVADSAAICDGYLLYTFPAGDLVVDWTYMSMAVTVGSPQLVNDTPDVGIGTVIGTGAVATLDGTATFEDLITGQTANDANGTAEVASLIPTAGAAFVILAAAAHTVHFNVADTWANDTSGDLTADIAGHVIIQWRHMGA